MGRSSCEEESGSLDTMVRRRVACRKEGQSLVQRRRSLVSRGSWLILLLASTWSSSFVSAEDTRRVLRASAPDYPDLMHASRSQGACIVAITVLPSGEVDHTHLQDCPSRYVESVLRRHAKQWRFEPQEHTTLHRIEFVFKLLPKDTPPEELGFVFVTPMTVEVRRVEPPVDISDRLR